MTPTETGTYTAKLTDGPLEGTTVRTAFTEGGDPVARLEIPQGREKTYLYVLGGSGLEFDGESGAGDRPSAVGYRFLRAAVVE
jgi:hypothetical protein